MKSKLINEDGGQRTFALVFDTGDEAMEGLSRFAREQSVSAAQLTGIGAFSEVVLGYFGWHKKVYTRIPLSEQVEVVSLLGDVALEGDEPVVHAHVVVGIPTGERAAATCSAGGCGRHSRSCLPNRRHTCASVTTRAAGSP